MSEPAQRARLPIIFGFIYGCTLFVLTFLAGGYGHGLYFPLALVSPPFCLIGAGEAFAGTLLVWPLLGFWSARTDGRWRQFTVLYLIVSYICVPIAMATNENFRDFGRWASMSSSIRIAATAALLVYALGQLLLWWWLYHSRNYGRPTSES